MRPTAACSVLSLFALAGSAGGQAGDQPGEAQPDPPADLEVPPAPVLSPADELATFDVPPGFRVELVAAEPLVEDPVAAFFDGDGGLWVCEMRGFMPNIDGTGEDAPVGAVARLVDVDGDGRMDERRVFLDGLVLPRAIAPAGDGLLVIAPPDLILARDTDGDGRADERTLIDIGLGGIESPEHAINGLLWTLDNGYRCANAPVAYRCVDGEWMEERTAGGGQWGITRDDEGRVLYDTNSDPLRGDLYPSRYAVRNPTLGRAQGVNVRLVQDMATWSLRPTPGVNRGYRQETLRDDFTLARYTAACGPLVFRGHGFPDAYRGNAFVCEPAGNLVQHYVLEPGDGIGVVGRPATPGRAFLASTDERFRPVNLLDGPDGALYVVDMYRGVIQHRIFVTSYLRRQVEARGLAEPLGLGRIWRVVHADAPPSARPNASEASWTELVDALSHPGGWWRDTAQRVLVEEGAGSRDANELLREAAAGAEEPLGRLHALWALAGIRGTNEALVLRALADDDPRVVRAAVRISEPFLAAGSDAVRARLVALGLESDARTHHQVLLSLGEAGTESSDAALARVLVRDASTRELRDAALSGLGQRELAFLVARLDDEAWSAEAPGRAELLAGLARCVVREGRADRLEELLTRVAGLPPDWRRRALVEGVLAARPPDPRGEPGPIRLRHAPAAADGLAALERGEELLAALAWPGKPGLEEVRVRPLSEEEEERFRLGSEVYERACAQCHASSGLGDPGKAPQLRYSPWVLGPDSRLVRILLQGLEGPVLVQGELWDQEMPALVASDEELAAVLTYARREWGHGVEPVAPARVAEIRRATSERAAPWTVEELELLE